MPTKKTPKFDGVIDGIRVRVYATRTEFEAVYDDDDYLDPKTCVICYPKIGDAESWAFQARLDYERHKAVD